MLGFQSKSTWGLWTVQQEQSPGGRGEELVWVDDLGDQGERQARQGSVDGTPTRLQKSFMERLKFHHSQTPNTPREPQHLAPNSINQIQKFFNCSPRPSPRLPFLLKIFIIYVFLTA